MDLKIEYIRDRVVLALELESFTGTVEDAARKAGAQMAINKADLARILDAETEEELKALVRGGA